jgi:hypothetical protein
LTIGSFLSQRHPRHRLDGRNRLLLQQQFPPCHLPQIHVPLLVAAMGGHYFIRDNEIHYEAAGSADKDFIVVEGAEHGQTPCVECGPVPGRSRTR